MSTPVKPIPDGFHSVTPYFTVRDSAKAIAFYKKAFGAKERYRLLYPSGKKVAHAEITIGDSIMMLTDESPEYGAISPKTLKGSSVRFCIYVPDVDAAFKRAVKAGAKVVQPVKDQFFGDRSGCLADPFGHQWSIMTHQQDMSPAEMKRRFKAMCDEGKKKK